MNAHLRRLRLDPYIVSIMAIVAVAAIIPARGVAKEVLDHAVYAAIALLFFIYRAKISRRAIQPSPPSRRKIRTATPVASAGE